MGTTPVTFNGSSTYAADLQQNITHAVAIASIPLNQLNANVTALQGQSTEAFPHRFPTTQSLART